MDYHVYYTRRFIVRLLRPNYIRPYLAFTRATPLLAIDLGLNRSLNCEGTYTTYSRPLTSYNYTQQL